MLRFGTEHVRDINLRSTEDHLEAGAGGLQWSTLSYCWDSLYCTLNLLYSSVQYRSLYTWSDLRDEMSPPVCWVCTLSVSDVVFVHVLPAVIVPPPVPPHLAVTHQRVTCHKHVSPHQHHHWSYCGCRGASECPGLAPSDCRRGWSVRYSTV